MTPDQAGEYAAIPLATSAIAAPLFGYIVDRVGKKLHFLLTSTLLLSTVYLIFWFLPQHNNNHMLAVFPLLLFGMFNGLFEISIWPLFPFIVPHRVLATAVGLVSVCNAIFLAIIPEINGWLHDINSTPGDDDYTYVLVWMIALSRRFIA